MSQKNTQQYIAKYHSSVLKFILSKVKNPQLAEDLTQDVFLKLLSHLNNTPRIENLENYLFAVARNQVYDYWKQVANNVEIRDTYWREIQTNKIVNTYPLLQRDQDIIFQHITNQITDQQKRIFMLNRQEGMSYNEIACQLKLSKSTVKNHMVSALKIIRQFMDEHAEKLIFMAGVILILK